MQFYVCGGDVRYDYLVKLLNADGFSAQRMLIEDLGAITKACGALILPYPCVKNGMINLTCCKPEDILPFLEKARIIFAGDAPECLCNFARSHSIKLIDYAKNEEFLLENAAITAEAAVSLVMGEGKETLADKNIAVCGYGRIGMLLSGLLKALGCSVTVAARSASARRKAEREGFLVIPIAELAECVKTADIVFNTVPARIMDMTVLKEASKSCRFIELASHPGGFDLNAAQELCLNIEAAPGLPGKYAPFSAAKVIKKVILNSMEELI